MSIPGCGVCHVRRCEGVSRGSASGVDGRHDGAVGEMLSVRGGGAPQCADVAFVTREAGLHCLLYALWHVRVNERDI